MSTITDLSSQLAAAKTELESALSAGQLTRPIRSEIARIEAALIEARAAEANIQRAEVEQKASSIQAASTTLADAQHAAIEIAATAPELVQLGEHVPAIARDPRIEAAVAEVAAARAALDDAERIHRNLQVAAGKIQTRISEEQAKVAAIKARRAGGDKRDDDAGAVTLLGDDIADLQRLQSDAQAKANAADPHALVRALEQAQQRLDSVQAEAGLRIISERLQLAEKAFLRAYHAQRTAERAAGKHLSNPSGTYRPSTEFKSVISRH